LFVKAKVAKYKKRPIHINGRSALLGNHELSASEPPIAHKGTASPFEVKLPDISKISHSLANY